VSDDVCVLQLQLVIKTTKNDANKNKMDADNDSTVCYSGGWRKMMKISTRMSIEHEMTMKNHCWIVGGDEGLLSTVYFSHQPI